MTYITRHNRTGAYFDHGMKAQVDAKKGGKVRMGLKKDERSRAKDEIQSSVALVRLDRTTILKREGGRRWDKSGIVRKEGGGWWNKRKDTHSKGPECQSIVLGKLNRMQRTFHGGHYDPKHGSISCCRYAKRLRISISQL